MSDNISKRDVYIMKRKMKELEEEASDYEFGFEKPSEKKPRQQKKIFLVPLAKHTIQRAKKTPENSNFIETNNYDVNSNVSEDIQSSNENQNKQFGETLDYDKTKQRIEAEANVELEEKNENVETQTGDVYISNVKSTNILSEFNATNNDSFEIPLSPSEKDDLTLIENMPIAESDVSTEVNTSYSNEPILFRNNYFKIIEELGDSYRAMCLICGIDENNCAKQICSAKKNVSSNLITHLKVNIY